MGPAMTCALMNRKGRALIGGRYLRKDGPDLKRFRERNVALTKMKDSATEFRPSLRKLKATIGWTARNEHYFRFLPRTKDKKIRELWCGEISTMKHTGPRHCFTQVPQPDADPR